MNKTNTPLQREFFDAVKDGQIVNVRKMLTDHPQLLDAFDYDYYGATPITRACGSGHRETIDLLIEMGADVDRRSDWDMGPWSPLHCAVAENNSELAKYFLSQGATLDVHTAAALGRLEDLQRLLDDNPERVMEPGGDGCHPLHFAGTPEIADELLRRGADINARCLDHNSTPIQYMATTRPQMAKALMSRGAETDIFSAALVNDDEQVRNLIRQDPTILSQRINQDRFPPPPGLNVHNIMTFTVGLETTPLHAATKGNSPEVIDVLLEHGMDPNVRGGYDEATALHIAAWENHVGALEHLLDGGAEIDIRSGSIHNNSPAGWAIVAGSADAFSLLLDHGATKLDFFQEYATAGVAGHYCGYSRVPMEQRQRILDRL